MKTSEAVEIIKNALSHIERSDVSNDVVFDMQKILAAFEMQKDLEAVDQNTRGHLRAIIRYCDIVFSILTMDVVSENTKKTVVMEAKEMINQAKAEMLV